MNATDDGVEPIGENPDVPARYDAGMTATLAAIDRGAVLGILSAADTVLATKQLAERQGQALSAIRARAVEWRDDDRNVAQLRAAGRIIVQLIDEAGA
ncbi:hypothetical protein ACRCUN_06065 [Mycobacterium sp. LTG2003]